MKTNFEKRGNYHNFKNIYGKTTLILTKEKSSINKIKECHKVPNAKNKHVLDKIK